MNKTQIGWYHLDEEKEFRNTYECAAWYEDVLVQPGTYPVYVYNKRTETRKNGEQLRSHIDMAYVLLPGIITSDEFGARFCGVPIGTYDNKQNAGKESSHSMSTYLYAMASDILKGGKKWELFPEYEARKIKFQYNGEDLETTGIFVREEKGERHGQNNLDGRT